MSRKDTILETLKRQYELGKLEKKQIRIESSDLAEALGYDRSNVSRDLNELVREGKVKKSEGRPVYFWPSEYEAENQEKGKNEFSFILGENESLKKNVQQAKAAVLYPPRGLHTLLVGPTGTGKTTFAERMYEYARYMKVIPPTAKFVVFNCAEYAENPQLLMSQMFGHKKGAFTGAQTDKPGLVELADGGMLFLDEIHRLPADGQEMLFLLMDKGIYRRLGETEGHRKASVMIIGATTENTDALLLKTFLRRMPMVIKMPSLEERSVMERLQLIEQFFLQEQKNMGALLYVDKEVLLALLTYECSGNVGQLRADIQLICARAFLIFKLQPGSNRLEVGRKCLPDYIWLDYSQSRIQTNDLLLFLQNDETFSMEFPGNRVYAEHLDKAEEKSICAELSEKYREYKKQGKTEEEIEHVISQEIDRYTKRLLSGYKMENGEKATRESILKVVSPRVYDAVSDALNYASAKLEWKFSDTVLVGMTMHVEALIKRIEKGEAVRDDDIDVMVLKYPKELKTAKIIRAMLEEELDIEIPFSELGYLTMFLCSESIKQETSKIGLIVVAHGRSTASSMAEVANKILGTKHCKSVDMPLDTSVNDTFEKTRELVEKEDQGKGVILLVDMGSLIWFAEQISEETGREVISMEMVSTIMVIDTLRKILMENHCIKEICTQSGFELDGVSGRKRQRKYREKIKLIVTCISGRGTAVRLGEIIRESLREYGAEFEFIYMNLLDKKEVEEKVKAMGDAAPRAVVGTVDLGLEEIPFISVEELVTGSGMANLEQILFRDERGIEKKNRREKDLIMEEALGRVLNFLDPVKMYACTQRIYKKIILAEKIKDDRRLRLRFIIHVSCMAERVIQNNIFQNHQTEQLRAQYQSLFDTVEAAMAELETFIGVKIPDSECTYLIELFTETD